MLIVVARALILYILIVVIMRMMGKRQVGQLQPSELVVAILIADLALSRCRTKIYRCSTV